MRHLLPLAAALLLAVAWGRQDSEITDETREPLVLTYLANEGFLVEVGEQSVLIDAFIGMPYAGYPALPKDVLARLRSAAKPFDDVELALTSHVHGDHFQASGIDGRSAWRMRRSREHDERATQLHRHYRRSSEETVLTASRIASFYLAGSCPR